MSVTTSELVEQIQKIVDLRDREKIASNEKKLISEALDSEESTMMDLLSKAELSSFKSDLGTVSLSFRTSVKLPQSKENWDLLLNYARDNGLESLIKINSQSVNAMYRDGLDAAIMAGGTDFTLPGVEPATITPQLSLRAK